MESVVERFLRYVSYETTSDEFTGTTPSTPGQKVLGAALAEEMKAITAPFPGTRACPPSA